MHKPAFGTVRLEPLGMQHLDALADMAFAQDLWKYHTRRLVAEEDLQRYIDDAMADRRAMRAYPFAIKHLEKDQWAGCTRFEAFDWKDRNLSIGHTWIGTGHRASQHADASRVAPASAPANAPGSGHAPQAIPGLVPHMALALLEFAFENLGMERVSTRCDARNASAIARLEQLGIAREGRLRSHRSNWDGYRRDSILFGMLRHEWPGFKTRWSS